MRKTTAKILEQVMPKTTRRKRAPIAQVAPIVAAPIVVTPTVVETTIAPPAPTHAMIAARAYALFVARGREHGRAHEDWARAERELTAR